VADLLEIAQKHQRRIIKRTDRAIAQAVAAWATVDMANLDRSWQSVGPAVTDIAMAAQNLNAADATGYVNQAAASFGDSRSTMAVNSSAFAGVDGSGREIGSLLFGAVTTTKQFIGAGHTLEQAFIGGQTFLAAMMKTALHDTSRSADLTAMAGKKYTRYVRVVQPGACSRCAVLAGISSAKTAFKRHPACKCTTCPLPDDGEEVPAGFHDSAEAYFDSLSEGEQDRVFTKAGAQAIREGADITQTVTARRGATGIQYGNSIGRETRANSGRQMLQTQIGRNADGSPIFGYVTTEGTTRRGDFGRVNRNLGAAEQRRTGARYTSTKYTRLMPETIVGLTDDLALRQTLLRDAGYMRVNLATSDPRRLAAAAEDRAVATKFYRSLGINLG
jgi:hypothetical protein